MSAKFMKSAFVGDLDAAKIKKKVAKGRSTMWNHVKGGDGSFHPTCFFAIPLGLGELGGSPRCMVAWRALELLTPEHSILIHQSDRASHTNRTSKRDLRAFRKSFTIPSGTKRCIEAPCFPPWIPHFAELQILQRMDFHGWCLLPTRFRCFQVDACEGLADGMCYWMLLEGDGRGWKMVEAEPGRPWSPKGSRWWTFAWCFPSPWFATAVRNTTTQAGWKAMWKWSQIFSY